MRLLLPETPTVCAFHVSDELQFVDGNDKLKLVGLSNYITIPLRGWLTHLPN
jgi:hypothetical protein